MKNKLFVLFLMFLSVLTLSAQTLDGAKPRPTVVDARQIPSDAVFFQVSNWFQAGMMLETLEMSPTLRYFDAKTASIMLPADWEAEQKQLERLEELKGIELSSFDTVKPQERIIGESTTTTKDGTLTTTTISVGPVSPEKKAPPESIAIGLALVSSIQGRLGDDPGALWNFNFGRNVNKALLNADSHNDALRLDGVQTFRQFVKTAPPDVQADLIEVAEQMAVVITKGIFNPTDAVKFTPLISKAGSLIGMRPALPKTPSPKP